MARICPGLSGEGRRQGGEGVYGGAPLSEDRLSGRGPHCVDPKKIDRKGRFCQGEAGFGGKEWYTGGNQSAVGTATILSGLSCGRRTRWTTTKTAVGALITLSTCACYSK